MSDNWDFYFCHVDNNPASIFVDLGIHADAPLPELTEMVWLRLYVRQLRDNGLPRKEEFDRLKEIEDVLTESVSDSATKTTYVGRNTSDGRRDFYFYTTNALQAESCLSAAMVPFPEYEFETGHRPDPKWSTYFAFLYPSPRSYQTMMNSHTLENLKRHDDKHEIEREVCHWIYFPSAEDRSRFLAASLEKGYRSVKEWDDDKTPRPYGLTIARVTTVDYTTINNVVLELFDLAQECNGDYDGWETQVTTGA